MCGRLKSKFKWRRPDIGTKATMATALTVKNFFLAKKMNSSGCVRTKGSHTLTCKLFHWDFWFLAKWLFSDVSSQGFTQNKCNRFPTSSALYVHVVPFEFASCDRVIYCLEKAHRRLQKQTLGWKDAQVIFTAMMWSRRFERSHMTSASIAVNGLLFDHFGIEKWSSPRITFARTKNRIFPFPRCLIDHSLKYEVCLRTWEFEVSKINFVFTGPRVPSRRCSNWLARVHRGQVIESMSEKNTCIHT